MFFTPTQRYSYLIRYCWREYMYVVIRLDGAMQYASTKVPAAATAAAAHGRAHLVVLARDGQSLVAGGSPVAPVDLVRFSLVVLAVRKPAACRDSRVVP